MSGYTPRRASARWLDADCPARVLAILDNRGATADRYTVLYRPAAADLAANGRGATVPYLAASVDPYSPTGVGLHHDMPAHQAASFRSRERSARWSELPEPVQRAVRADAQALDAAERLEELRGELRAERISYGELAELQALAAFITPGDAELLEAAGVEQ